MRDIFIKYNPYKLETEILIDGKVPKQNSRLQVGERRLQEWIESLPEILLEECGNRDYSLTFQGTTLDYEDVEDVVNQAGEKGLNIQLKQVPVKEVKDKEQALDVLFQKIQQGPFEQLRQPDVLRAFELAKSSDFEVNVIATMSAGKSSLINALLQQKLMPSKQEACTATITEIKDTDVEGFTAKVYDRDNDLIETEDPLTYETMERLNGTPEVSKIRVEGNIPFVTAEDVSLVLVDTPGPNNSRDVNHKKATFRMLSESSKALVLYILNGTQLAVNDDNNLLNHVADSMAVGGKQSRDRFLFVVNKLDDFKKEDSVEDALHKVRDYLRDHGIENPNIYPASALTALNVRTMLTEGCDEDDDDVYEAIGKVRRFNRNENMHFERFAPLTPSVRGRIQTALQEAVETHDANRQALIHCGIIPLEQAIRNYVQKYAKTAKLKNIVDTFRSKLESAECFEKTKQSIAENQQRQEAILQAIGAIRSKLASGEEAKKFKARIASLNYDKDIKAQVSQVEQAATKEARSKFADVAGEISPREAEELCNAFVRYTGNLQADVQVKLENIINQSVITSASQLLKEYTEKIVSLGDGIQVEGVNLDPFKMMQGDIVSLDAHSLVSSLTESRRVKVDEVWVENTSKAWWKPWTWFSESGHWKSVYENQEYVDSEALMDRFSAPVKKILFENCQNAMTFAKSTCDQIKNVFQDKFAVLDQLLQEKLKELEACAQDQRDAEARLQETREKLAWLETVQAEINAILDI